MHYTALTVNTMTLVFLSESKATNLTFLLIMLPFTALPPFSPAFFSAFSSYREWAKWSALGLSAGSEFTLSAE